MATPLNLNSKNPTIRRILREAADLQASPPSFLQASPLDSDLFEWHFTLRGPPSSPYSNGLYHGRIVLPPTYPLRPPSFRFLTPSGRFEVNREICLSISGHHEETWQPAWGVRTALVALRTFMESRAKGQVGGLEAGEDVRRRLAGESRAWRCGTCGVRNDEVGLGEGEEGGVEVPRDLMLGYRDQLGKEKSLVEVPETQALPPETRAPAATAARAVAASGEPSSVSGGQAVQLRPPLPLGVEAVPRWVDTAIVGVLVSLFFLVMRKLYV
ncbi:MAG: hypothetical protein M1829_006775 [Trizodia sp. TS-e1964]|nr:MAG: hypothetical protein M1829_006775 [Trizodia sp. TS-e1964]